MKKINFIFIVVLFSTFSANTQTLPSYVPSNGLISWYPFTGNANDSSGNGNHATVNGAVLASDRFGNNNSAYSFNGSSDYLHGNATSFPTEYRTISLWFYSTSINTLSTGMQVFGYGGGICNQSWLMQMDNPTPSTSFFTENTYEVSMGCNNWLTALPFGVNGTPSTPNNNWQHWVMTNGQSGIDIYINGNYVGGITTPITGTGVAGKKFFIGACPDSSGMNAYQDAYLKHWNGILDDVGIWNRALSQQEISDLYNGTTLDVSDLSPEQKFSVYPNPATDRIFVEQGDFQEYTISDLLGRTVKSGQLDADNFIDINSLAQGIYILNITGESKQSFKLVKE